ncbi:unnamed protein product [Moneuplotes crassus]|uniref:EamA domain-containing protein n=1 Tax=Euplotes crassus TaxID=5936 RepID=A0AAD1XJ53_EUPCR|nr:unnamed protein product [Moneuplotes crassus]
MLGNLKSEEQDDLWSLVSPNDKRKSLLEDFEASTEESTKELASFEVHSNYWILWGILGGITAGIGSLFVGKASTEGFHARSMISIGNLIAGIGYFSVKTAYQRLNGEGQEDDVIEIREYRTHKGLKIAIIFVDALVSIGGGFLVVLTFEYAFYAGINQGIISTLFSFTSVFLSIFGWLLFDERINSVQIIGMISMTTSAILYGFSGSGHTQSNGSAVSSILPILFGLISTIYFTGRSLALKAFCVRYQYSALDFMSISYIICGSILLIPFLTHVINYGVEMSLLKDCIIGGILQETSMIMMYYSISTGYSGPAAALSSIQAPLQTALAAIFLFQVPSPLQVSGLILAMIGSILISTSTQIMGLLNLSK